RADLVGHERLPAGELDAGFPACAGNLAPGLRFGKCHSSWAGSHAAGGSTSRLSSAVAIPGSGLIMSKSAPPSNKQSMANCQTITGHGSATAGVLNGASQFGIGLLQASVRARKTHAPEQR